MPRAGDEPNRENTGQGEVQQANHPKIHPTDSQTAELLELWAIMDSEGRESLLSLIRSGQERPSENAPATG